MFKNLELKAQKAPGGGRAFKGQYLTLQLGGVSLSRDAALLPTVLTRAAGQLTVCSTSSKDLATK